MQDNVPTLGFYGTFEPAVQTYSCRGSVFWMGKLFLGLYTPANSAFWTAVENEGPWKDSLKFGTVYNQLQQNTDLLITDYPGIGAAEIRATTHSKNIGVYQGTENYNRLAYNSVFPWQADGKHGEVAMNYLLKQMNDTGWEAGRMFVYKGYKDGVYYRDLSMAADSNVNMQLAEMTLPDDIIRVDKIIAYKEVSLRLGHYALPQLNKPITTTTRKIKGGDIVIIDNEEYQLAMIALSGWQQIEAVSCVGLLPQSNKSMVVDANAIELPGNRNYPPLISIMLWKKAGEKFTRKELLAVKKLQKMGTA